MKITDKLRLWGRGLVRKDDASAPKFAPPVVPPGVVPVGGGLAMDSAYDYLNANCAASAEGFVGYPALAALFQLPEYRMLMEKTPEAMTRKWIVLGSKGDGDKSDIVAAIQDELVRLKVRELFRDAATYDNGFGRCQLFIDVGRVEGPELATPLITAAAKIPQGSLRALKLVEPIYTYPASYNSLNPLADDYYRPSSWYVMGGTVHASRLLLFVSRPVPTILKPAYNFGGMSLSQLARPYVDNWLRTRSSVGQLISNFSTSGIKTNMSAALSGGEDDDIIKRAELFAQTRDNFGVMLLDNNVQAPEEFFQFNVPLSSLDKLQAQSQEHMSSVSGIPLSILLGITPTGLNASTDGEIRTFYDHVLSAQESQFREPLQRVLDIIQLSKFGTIDPDVTFSFVPLWQQSATELAANRKTDAETAQIYVDMAAISTDEVRAKLAADHESGYAGLAAVVEGLTPEPDGELE